MKKFLVGGAVRDELLKLPVTDRDWVVVGSTPDEMIEAGFRPVGKDFPVFLHPYTHEEYALARTERKTGRGYHGFSFISDNTVSLEEDLGRRDLTINAIAKDESGALIDPFHGTSDIDDRLLRHVSPAFVEDPVRVLRVARFMARFTALGFRVADETLSLMQTMALDGEVNCLVPERVWQEMHKALTERHPRAFIETLRACQALIIILPELEALFGVPQKKHWHPEVDTGVHTLMVLDQCAKLTNDADTRFAALCHDLGKALTPADELPSHKGHEERGVSIVESLCERLRIPKKTRDLAVLVTRYHTHSHRALELNASSLTKLMHNLDVIRKPERFKQFLIATEADAKGRLGFENTAYPQSAYLEQAAEVFRAVDASEIAHNTSNKAAIPDAIKQARVLAIKQWMEKQ